MKAVNVEGLGFDTLAVVDPARASILKAHGYNFVFRYLSRGKVVHDEPPSEGYGNLSRREFEWLLAAGLDVGLVQRGCSRTYPDAEVGKRLGEAMVYNAQQLGVPDGVHLFSSLEYQGSRKVKSEDQAGCIEEIAAATVADGCRSGYYGSFDGVLSSVQLYALKGVTSYWASATWYPRRFNPAPRGWGIQQGPQVTVLGLVMDQDIVVRDGVGGRPYMVGA
jgi:hypothetical protein